MKIFTEGRAQGREGGKERGGLTSGVIMFPAERDSEADSFIVQLFRMDFE